MISSSERVKYRKHDPNPTWDELPFTPYFNEVCPVDEKSVVAIECELVSVFGKLVPRYKLWLVGHRQPLVYNAKGERLGA